MRNAQHIFDSLSHVLSKKFDVEITLIKPEASLVDLGLDSLTLMEFIFEAEDTFHLRIPEDRLSEDLSKVTLADVCQAIETIQAAKQSEST
jgi:acyl carrier protein